MEEYRFERNGEKWIVDRPWWVSHAYYMQDNISIVVARCNAKKADDPGKFSTHMLDLTEDDLVKFPVTPGNRDKQVKGDDGGWVWTMTEGRPTTNRLDKVGSLEQVIVGYNRLQNEGYEEEERTDRTPYQKGDAGDQIFEEKS